MEAKLAEIKDTEPKRNHGNIEDLKASIKKLGLLQPLVITPEYSLIAGRRRYQALVELGFDKVPVYIIEPKDDYIKFLMALDENLKRKEMTWQEIAACELEEKRIYEECYGDTEENRRLKASSWKELPADSAPSYAQAKAKASHKSERVIQEEIQLAEAIEEEPEKYEKVRTKQQALRILRAPVQQDKRRNIPKGTYNVILADPPWQYNNKIQNWGAAELHYQTMSTQEICEMKVESTIADNAVLFLWVTNPFLQEGFEVCKAWGFEYKTNVVWVKRGLKKPGSGFYVRGRHELLYIATKGSFLPKQDIAPPIGSVIEAEVQEHSKKPEIQYQIIETLYPNCKYLELFAREKREGWISWGNEIHV